MATTKVPAARDAQRIAALLQLPEIMQLIADLGETRWTGRPGYPVRAMAGAALVKAVYALPAWTRTVRLIAEHAALREVPGGAPSHWACYRFAGKLRGHGGMLTACLDRVLASLHGAGPLMGEVIAIDGPDLPAYANGHRHLFQDGPLRTKFAGPGASWGHRPAISVRKGGGYYGCKIHAAVCTRTGLPVAWTVRAAADSEQEMVPGLLDAVIARGFTPAAAAMDKGYDGRLICEACEKRKMRPVIPLKLTAGVRAGPDNPPSCEHGTWTFAGSGAKRGASKWRCRTGKCQPASTWVKAGRLHPLIPRSTGRRKMLCHQRASVEREFGRLKHEWGMLPLRVRRLPRVTLHVNLTILGQLAGALLEADAAGKPHRANRPPC
jgi:Transposase DDE domain